MNKSYRSETEANLSGSNNLNDRNSKHPEHLLNTGITLQSDNESTCKVIPLYPELKTGRANSEFKIVSVFKSGKQTRKATKFPPLMYRILSWTLIMTGVICLIAGFIIEDTMAELYKALSIIFMLLGINCSQYNDEAVKAHTHD